MIYIVNIWCKVYTIHPTLYPMHNTITTAPSATPSPLPPIMQYLNVSLERLQNHVNPSELPTELGGNLTYRHHIWIEQHLVGGTKSDEMSHHESCYLSIERFVLSDSIEIDLMYFYFNLYSFTNS